MRHAIFVSLHLLLALLVVASLRATPHPPLSVAPVASVAPVPSVASVADLAALDAAIDQLMRMIQDDSAAVSAMKTLALVYLAHGWDAAAVGPLARALQLAPDDPELADELRRALARSGGDGDAASLAAAAREFIDTVAMWGMGC